MNWDGRGMKCSWPNLWQYPEIYLIGLKKRR